MPESSPVQPRGLVFFSRHGQPAHRRRRWTFVGLYALVAAMLLWPLGALAARVFPLVLGLPFALAWVVLALLVMFGALIWLFLTEEQPDEIGS